MKNIPRIPAITAGMMSNRNKATIYALWFCNRLGILYSEITIPVNIILIGPTHALALSVRSENMSGIGISNKPKMLPRSMVMMVGFNKVFILRGVLVKVQ